MENFMKTARGMHKIEFYSHINEIRTMYQNGYVVLKILYKELKDKYNWKMSYWSFCKYMNEEMIGSKNSITPVTQKDIQAKEEAENYLKKIDSKINDSKTKVKKETKTSDQADKEKRAQEILKRNANFINEKWR